MYDRRTIAKLVAGASALVPALARAEIVRSSRAAEAAALVRFAEETHPRGAEARLSADWRARASSFITNADPVSYAAYVIAAYRLLAWFKDGHTTLWSSALDQGPFGLEIPIGAAAFFDGLYIIQAEPAQLALLGARVTRIGSVPTIELIRRFSEIWPADNAAWVHHDADLLLATPGFLHGLGAINGADDSPVRLQVTTPGGLQLERNLLPHAPSNASPVTLARKKPLREIWAAEARTGNYVRRLPSEQALYVSLDDLSVKVPIFVAFLRGVFSGMAESRWDRLILDLRRNGGGNNFLGEPLRKQLARSRFNRPGKLYVLISPTTFSAAQNLVNRLERETFAIFAGEPTGGAPRHFGDSKRFESGAISLRGGVSTMAWFDSYPQDQRRWVMPDMLVPRTFADWSAGRDPVLDAVLKDRTIGEPDEISDDRVFYFRRKSQSAEWKPFWLA